MRDAAPPVLRTAHHGDLPGLRGIVTASLVHDPDAARVLTLLWELTADRPDLRVVTEADGVVTGLALGRLAPQTDGPHPRTGHTTLLAVAPGHRGRGHGRTLLAGVEERLLAAGATRLVVRGTPPHYAWPGLDIRYTPAVCLLEAAGYEHTADAFNMLTDLAATDLTTAEDERRLAALGVRVRRARPEDAPRFLAWMRGWGGSWAEEAAAALAHEPPRCHVAVQGDGTAEEFVGFACHGVNRDTWFGPMGTAESQRGRGVGAVLLRRCLRDQREAGLAESEIAWIAPYRFYARAVDARLHRVFRLYQKEPLVPVLPALPQEQHS
ncbi:GNAT family N-acetyltransferase [Kitasatospora phosalacinea]|uniref:GNAT family N-acetyltransferase n=1 Tax=Kitasatospora phosalacinea TaxID=2065 RepID=UPI00131D2492|nr:GNAT family N-acetyltransferase [Kitasatospora phosalacinea]